jgi:hypothetical protein
MVSFGWMVVLKDLAVVFVAAVVFGKVYDQHSSIVSFEWVGQAMSGRH